jgi:hypothetical protein
MVRRYRLLLEVGETILLGRDGQLSCMALQFTATSCTEFDSFGCVARAVRNTVHVHLRLTTTGQARFHKEGDPYGPHQ